MENYEETNIMPFANTEEFNYNVINDSLCTSDDSILLKCLDEEVVVETSIEDSLVGSVVLSKEHAFKLYNDHGFRLGFSVRKGNQKFKIGCKTKYLNHFCCYKQWMKADKGKGEKTYIKVDFRTGCKAIDFWLNDKGGWIVSIHDVSHNHGFCDVNQRRFMHSQSWLNRLYNLREKCCPVFNKDFFSGSVLSSQRSEETNHSISRRLSKTTTLCDFYRVFDEVVSEWRSNANMEDFCYKEGYIEMIVTKLKLLKHANEVYTIGAYKIFEEQFMKFPEYYQGLVVCNEREHMYEDIPDKYILKRWTKDIDFSLGSSNIGDVGKVRKKDISVKLNINASESIEEGFRMIKDNISSEVGPYCVDNSDNEVGSSNIKDPVRRRAKGECNIRKKSIVEIKYNQARGKRKSALTHTSRIKTAIQLSMKNEVLGRNLNFTSSECEISLGTSNNGNVEFINFI
ncbi:hypothetical protein M9H77_03126 [Catharanthus roseus]|uniref:Uncharacterized protein n=1 Tax=Catharanthus roseus TaxID=4058 RepID=A0ACC0CAV0_CATRO|nr:hypothetical protein M9H77_03126 [Catharanthus roseus]